MRKTIKNYTHEEYGSIRILFDGRMTMFCANDVARSCGYLDPWSAVRYHCPNREIHFCLGRKMNFIGFNDLVMLAFAADHTKSLAFLSWLMVVVAPDFARVCQDALVSGYYDEYLDFECHEYDDEEDDAQEEDEDDAGITINITVDADNLFSWLADHLNARVGVSE